MIGDYDREASAVATSTATPEQVLRLATDLTGFSSWFEMHESWRGDVPARATLGLEVVESVRLMGIPAEIAWTVVRLDHRTFALSGEGPERSEPRNPEFRNQALPGII